MKKTDHFRNACAHYRNAIALYLLAPTGLCTLIRGIEGNLVAITFANSALVANMMLIKMTNI